MAAILVLTALDAVLWHIVFRDGLPENYVYPRPAPLIDYELAAVIVTAVLLVAVFGLVAPTARGWRAAGLGGLLGLLAAAPAQLLLFADVRSNPGRDGIRIVWTTVSWAITAAAIGWFLNRRRPNDLVDPHQR